MKQKALLGIIFICFSMLYCSSESNKTTSRIPQVEFALDIDRVWAGQPVDFHLLTKDDKQFVAFYDQERKLTVASRNLDSYEWEFQKLPCDPGWSSHKSVTFAIDDEGLIHLSGCMHSNPLVYFRTSEPYNIKTFQQITEMIGKNEKKCTYPQFFRGPGGEFMFHYRDGSSGKGNEIFNVFDQKTKKWRRLMDTPLADGEGVKNAYLNGPVTGPDGYFHLSWLWRDTPDCVTNHDLSYVRSKDLINWETISGEKVDLPITFATKGVVVDPTPFRGGLINTSNVLGFDSKKRPIISYHKYDKNGKSQAYNARLEKGQWKIYQTSDWDYRWYFHGFGAIEIDISIGPVVLKDEGLTQLYNHKIHGSGEWVLDEKTLKPIGNATPNDNPLWPKDLLIKESFDQNMQINWKIDAGEIKDKNAKYVLRWETLPMNRDRPRDHVPKPSTLRLYKIRYD